MDISAFISRYRVRPFVWGECDCCLFAADWVVEQVGVDPAAQTRGRYNSAKGALKVVRQAGFDDMCAMVDSLLGERIAPLQLQRGDIALVENGGDPALGICWGANVFAMSQSGVVGLPANTIITGWRLPCHR